MTNKEGLHSRSLAYWKERARLAVEPDDFVRSVGDWSVKMACMASVVEAAASEMKPMIPHVQDIDHVRIIPSDSETTS